MFPLYDFLIYCFICAYTPGANNLLSMSNAARLGFRRSVVFNLGITAGFFLVMSICTFFSATLYTLLPRVKIFMEILGALYMLYLAWKVWKSSGPPVYEPQDLHLRHYRHVSLHSAGVFFSPGPFRLCSGADGHRRLRILCMGPVRRCLLPVLRPAYKGCKPGDGSASGVLCSVTVSIVPVLIWHTDHISKAGPGLYAAGPSFLF